MPIPAEENIKYCHVTLPDDKSFTYDHVWPHIRAEEQITLHQSAEWRFPISLPAAAPALLATGWKRFQPVRL